MSQPIEDNSDPFKSDEDSPSKSNNSKLLEPFYDTRLHHMRNFAVRQKPR